MATNLQVVVYGVDVCEPGTCGMARNCVSRTACQMLCMRIKLAKEINCGTQIPAANGKGLTEHTSQPPEEFFAGQQSWMTSYYFPHKSRRYHPELPNHPVPGQHLITGS